jgi:hypothetical protein
VCKVVQPACGYRYISWSNAPSGVQKRESLERCTKRDTLILGCDPPIIPMKNNQEMTLAANASWMAEPSNDQGIRVGKEFAKMTRITAEVF